MSPGRSERLRGYFVYDKWEDAGVAVVAHTGQEAKKRGFSLVEGMHSSEWIDVTTRWMKDADVSGIDEPTVLSFEDGLRRGIFLYVEDLTCEVCGEDSHCEFVKGKIMCYDCQDKLEAGGITQ